MKNRLRSLLLVFAMCTVQFSAAGEEIVLTGNDARAPKVFNDAGGNASGVLIEVMNYVAQQTGEKFSYKLFPFARAYDNALKGNMGIIGLSLNQERLARFDYSKEALLYDDLVLVVRKGREFRFEAVGDLQGKKIGIPRGASFGDAYEQAVKDRVFEPIPGPRPSAQLAMLLLDRVDAVLVPMGRAGFEAALKGEAGKDADLRGEREKFVILPKPFARDPNYIAFAKSLGKQALLAKIDKALQKGHQSGDIERLVDRYIAAANQREAPVKPAQ